MPEQVTLDSSTLQPLHQPPGGVTLDPSTLQPIGASAPETPPEPSFWDRHPVARTAARILVPGGENTVQGIASGVSGLAKGVLGAGNALIQPPQNEEEQKPVYMSPPVLAAKRLILDPAQREREKAAQDFSSGGAGGYISGAVHAATSIIPGFGETLGNLYEKGKKNPVAATAEGLTYALAPEAFKEAAPYANAGAEGVASIGATLLDRSAKSNLEQTLGATTQKLKAISSDKVVPGMIERGITANTKQGISDIADRGVKEHGAAVDQALTKAARSGRELPTAPIIDDLESLKGDYTLTSKKTGTQTADRPEAIAQISRVQKILGKYGDTIRPDDLAGLRRFIDDEVSKKKMAFLADDTKGFDAHAQESAANLLRDKINSEFPDIAKANNEFSFYRNLKTVIDATLQRKASQSGLMARGLKVGIGALGGGAVAGPVGAAVGAGAELLHDTPAYRTRAAQIQTRAARILSP